MLILILCCIYIFTDAVILMKVFFRIHFSLMSLFYEWMTWTSWVLWDAISLYGFFNGFDPSIPKNNSSFSYSIIYCQMLLITWIIKGKNSSKFILQGCAEKFLAQSSSQKLIKYQNFFKVFLVELKTFQHCLIGQEYSH